MRRVRDAVPLEEAKLRALRHLATLDRRDLTAASGVAGEIWTGVKFTSQGAGGAASRILRLLEKDGLAEWIAAGNRWGWRITTRGRGSLDSASCVSPAADSAVNL